MRKKFYAIEDNYSQSSLGSTSSLNSSSTGRSKLKNFKQKLKDNLPVRHKTYEGKKWTNEQKSKIISNAQGALDVDDLAQLPIMMPLGQSLKNLIDFYNEAKNPDSEKLKRLIEQRNKLAKEKNKLEKQNTELDEENTELDEENIKLKVESSLKILRDLQSKLKSMKISESDGSLKELVDKLVQAFSELEEKKDKKVVLLKKFFKAKKSEENTDLENKLKDTNEKIKNLDEKVDNLKGQVDEKNKESEETIKKTEEELRKEKKNCIKELDEDEILLKETIWDKKLKGVDLSENLERLLQAQTEITKFNSYFANEEKTELLKEAKKDEKIFNKLNELCEEQAKIIRLEMQLEDVEKILRIIDINHNNNNKLKKDKRITLVSSIPLELLEEIKKEGKLEENYNIEIGYKEVHLRNDTPFQFQKVQEDEQKLPTKLYNVKTKQIEETEGHINKNYAILSYSWNDNIGIDDFENYESWRSKQGDFDSCEEKSIYYDEEADKKLREKIYKDCKNELVKDPIVSKEELGWVWDKGFWNKMPRLYQEESEEENNWKKVYWDIVYKKTLEIVKVKIEIWRKLKNSKEHELCENLSGKKSLAKAIEACQLLGIDYLWMDQLCINQNDIEEKRREVRRMRNYYSNAGVTLVAIHSNVDKEENFDLPNILSKIIRSKWFNRSWTYQEGWLSKHTIFMFDDYLVDGRATAALWMLCQPSYAEIAQFSNFENFAEGSAKVATPIGRVYYEEGYSSEDKVSLNLHEVLRATKNRRRAVTIDSIYSILGLLPYGNKIIPKYRGKLCKGCKKKENEQQKAVICGHTEEKKTEFPTYFKEELNDALLDVMKAAVEYGQGEPLAWHGKENDSLPAGLCWLPKIDTESGSISVEGGINIELGEGSKNIFVEDSENKNIKVNLKRIAISSLKHDITRIERGFLIDNGVYLREVNVELEDKKGGKIKQKKITLLGTRETLEKLKETDFLLIPNEKEWKSNKTFALLASREGDIYHRKGLVELFPRQAEKILKSEEEAELKIGMKDSSIVELKKIQHEPFIEQANNHYWKKNH